MGGVLLTGDNKQAKAFSKWTILAETCFLAFWDHLIA